MSKNNEPNLDIFNRTFNYLKKLEDIEDDDIEKVLRIRKFSIFDRKNKSVDMMFDGTNKSDDMMFDLFMNDDKMKHYEKLRNYDSDDIKNNCQLYDD